VKLLWNDMGGSSLSFFSPEEDDKIADCFSLFSFSSTICAGPDVSVTFPTSSSFLGASPIVDQRGRSKEAGRPPFSFPKNLELHLLPRRL